jgi:hypothetical protein
MAQEIITKCLKFPLISQIQKNVFLNVKMTVAMAEAHP